MKTIVILNNVEKEFEFEKVEDLEFNLSNLYPISVDYFKSLKRRNFQELVSFRIKQGEDVFQIIDARLNLKR